MEYTLPERNAIVEEIGQLEVDLNLVFSPTHNTPTAKLEAKRDELRKLKALDTKCTACRGCGC